MDFAQTWNELPTWAKWTVGIASAGAVGLFLWRARSGKRTPAADPDQAAAPELTPAPAVGDAGGSGANDWVTTALQRITVSQADLAGSQSALASSQSALVNQMQSIAAHQLSPGAGILSSSVQLSGGAVASDKDLSSPGTSAAQFAATQPAAPQLQSTGLVIGDPVREAFDQGIISREQLMANYQAVNKAVPNWLQSAPAAQPAAQQLPTGLVIGDPVREAFDQGIISQEQLTANYQAANKAVPDWLQSAPVTQPAPQQLQPAAQVIGDPVRDAFDQGIISREQLTANYQAANKAVPDWLNSAPVAQPATDSPSLIPTSIPEPALNVRGSSRWTPV